MSRVRTSAAAKKRVRRRWEKKHKNERSLYFHKYYVANKDVKLTRTKQWQLDNKKKLSRYRRTYYRKNLTAIYLKDALGISIDTARQLLGALKVDIPSHQISASIIRSGRRSGTHPQQLEACG